MRKPVPALDPGSIPGLAPRTDRRADRRPGPVPPQRPQPGSQIRDQLRQAQAAAGLDFGLRPGLGEPGGSGPGAPATPDHDQLRYLILAVQREDGRRHATRLRAAGLTPAQAEVLEVLAASAPLTLAELGRLLICETGSPSRLVDTLVQRGLVTRTPGDRDRRVVSLGLSPAGREALQSSAGPASPASGDRDPITARLSGPELGQLTTLLRKLLDGTPGAGPISARFPAASR